MVEASNAIKRANRALRLVFVSMPPAKAVVVASDTNTSDIKLLSHLKSFIINLLKFMYLMQLETAHIL